MTLVTAGDSIPNNSPDNCPGCTGFVVQYAEAVEEATGKDVAVQNLSEHTGLALPTLIDRLDSPAGLNPEDELKTRAMHGAWSTMLCTAAESNGFICSDVYHAFNGPDGTEAAGDLLVGDYVPSSQQGNDVIARVLEDEGFAPLE